MAIVAFVGMGGRGELATMAVRVAGRAGEFARNVHRFAALRPVAFGAAEPGVFSIERERALTVRLAVKAGGSETCHFVAGGAVRPGSTRGELAFMRIFVTIPATLVRHGAMEIGALVAFGTRHCRVLSQERKLRGGVIEVRARLIFLEATSVVARIAGTSELDIQKGPAVGVGVTALTTRVTQPSELSILLIGLGSVALLARHGLM